MAKRDEQIKELTDCWTFCANGVKYVTETEHIGTSRMKETIKDFDHKNLTI